MRIRLHAGYDRLLMLVFVLYPNLALAGWYFSAADTELSRSTHLRAPNQTNCKSQSFKFLLAFASTVIPRFSVLEIHDQDILFSTLYVFQQRISYSTREGSIFLCRRYVCCTVVSGRVYTPCQGVQVTTDSLHPLSLHYHNSYTRHTEVSCQCKLV
jgi:hypothetical protein